eukprot:jgi/Tetstr1/449498/TSEL_036588.t3
MASAFMQRRSGRGEGGEVPGAAAAGVPATAAYGTVRTGPGCHSIVAVAVPLLFVAALLVGFLSSSQAPATVAVAPPASLAVPQQPAHAGPDDSPPVSDMRWSDALAQPVAAVRPAAAVQPARARRAALPVAGEPVQGRGQAPPVAGAAGAGEDGGSSSVAMTWTSAVHREALAPPTPGSSGGKAKKAQPRAAQLMEFSTEAAVADESTEVQASLDPTNVTPLDGKLRLLPDGVVHALLKPKAARAKANHASTLLLLPSGELACAWFWGEEGESQVAIVMASLKPGAREWADLRVVSMQSGRSAQNPVLFVANSTMVLIHTSQLAGRGQGTAEIRVLRSPDGGYSWTPPRTLFKEAGAMVRNPPIPALLTPSEMLLPVYYTPSGMGAVRDQFSVMKWSSQPGSSWPQAKMARISNAGQGLVQPAVVRMPGGHILAFLRDRNSRGVYYSSSEDDGRTWKSPKPTGLPNNNKAVMAALLPSGALALVFTNSNSWARKHPISIALSTDGGKSWPVVRDLQAWFHKGGCQRGCEYSYPAMVWSPGRCESPGVADSAGKGALHLSYTYSRRPVRRIAIRYLCVNDPESWIRSGPPSQGVYKGPSTSPPPS